MTVADDVTLVDVTSCVFVLQPEDAGEYKCVATNDAGSSEGTAHVTVESKRKRDVKVFTSRGLSVKDIIMSLRSGLLSLFLMSTIESTCSLTVLVFLLVCLINWFLTGPGFVISLDCYGWNVQRHLMA